ncbi:MAG: hypothetical protein UDK36_05620 [Bacteroidaceae bacterium]|nr:hypothetical protein [Bacteroidaceae bacterium]
MLWIRVADTGCGMPKEKAETVFTRHVKLSGHRQGARDSDSVSAVQPSVYKHADCHACPAWTFFLFHLGESLYSAWLESCIFASGLTKRGYLSSDDKR